MAARPGIAREMIEGKQPFNLAGRKKVFATSQDAPTRCQHLFPDSSKAGATRRRLPAIWENKADFDAKLAKFGTDAKAAQPR